MAGRSATAAVPASEKATTQVRDVMLLMGDLLRDLRGSIDVLAARHGLTAPLADLLWQIEPDHPLPMRSAADRISCDPSNVTFLADRLEERGLVERRANPVDRRVKLLALTDEGLHVREQLLAEVVAASPFGALSATDLAALRRLLQKVARAS
jgi:DNA-binding MarR family transcriptional regulator